MTTLNNQLEIIAGPCSIDQKNIKEIYQLANLKLNNNYILMGTRVVGLKSRTQLSHDGNGMGIDYQTILQNQNILDKGGKITDLLTPPSIKLAQEIQKKTDLLVATEIMLPILQIPQMLNKLKSHKVLLWNPSVNQLGWQIKQMSKYANQQKWYIGIKNGKWVGAQIEKTNQINYNKQTTLEKTWTGLVSYSHPAQTILIHRGVDVPEKKLHRNLPIHQIASRVKQHTKCKLFFDPSHIYGPKLKHIIVTETIKAMQIKINNQYLYDGILIEVGTSQTDTEQHISLVEFKNLIEQLSQFRTIISNRITK